LHVVYQCPPPAGPLYRGAYTAELVVTAGPACCRGQGKAIATIIKRPTVAVLPPTTAVVICEDLQDDHVDVTFTVQADAPGLITVPGSITPTAGQGACTTSCEYECCLMVEILNASCINADCGC
jgi:hypothetical protein